MRSLVSVVAVVGACALVGTAIAAPTIYSPKYVSSTAGSVLVRFDANTPGSETTIGTILPGSATFIAGMDFSADGRLWGTGQGTAVGLYSINKATGAGTRIGTGAGLTAGDAPSDMSWNPVDLRMYVLGIPSAPGTVQRLYTVDLFTGVFTLVATMTAPGAVLCAGLSIASNGEVFLQDVNTDRMYKLVGSNLAAMASGFGFNANLSQGMTFNHADDQWYYGAYNTTISTAQLYRVNRTTGACTLVGRIGATTVTTYSDIAIERPYFQCQADFNNDGIVDFFDYLDFVAAFSAGCP